MAKEFADKLWELFAQLEGGATIGLIEAFTHCAVERFCGISHPQYNLEEELASILQIIPHAVQNCNALLQADKLQDEDFWNILPFNYK